MVTELECLETEEAVKKFRAFLEGGKFEVVVHVWLKWLIKPYDLHARLVRMHFKIGGIRI